MFLELFIELCLDFGTWFEATMGCDRLHVELDNSVTGQITPQKNYPVLNSILTELCSNFVSGGQFPNEMPACKSQNMRFCFRYCLLIVLASIPERHCFWHCKQHEWYRFSHMQLIITNPIDGKAKLLMFFVLQQLQLSTDWEKRWCATEEIVYTALFAHGGIGNPYRYRSQDYYY